MPHVSHSNVLGCRCVYRTKTHADGFFERRKALLVAKGFCQQPEINSHDTFNPVVKPSKIHLVLSIVVSHGWSLRQIDIQNAFLHGILTDEVYMQQSQSFIDSTWPNHVYKLHKAIYSLKQAPRA